jgi:hypothetical protein
MTYSHSLQHRDANPAAGSIVQTEPVSTSNLTTYTPDLG